MSDDPIAVPVEEGEVDLQDYWKLEISGITWTYVITKLIHDYTSMLPLSARAVLVGTRNNRPIYMLHKRYVPTSVLIKATGKDAAWLEKQETIELTEKKRDDLPEPTVSYWGEG